MINVTITVLLTVAVCLLIILTAATVKKVGDMDSTLDTIDDRVNDDAATATANKIFVERKIEDFDQELTAHKIEYYDQGEAVINLLEQIVKSIGRLDAIQTRDHRDLVDIRSRYINFREPIQEDTADGRCTD